MQLSWMLSENLVGARKYLQPGYIQGREIVVMKEPAANW